MSRVNCKVSGVVSCMQPAAVDACDTFHLAHVGGFSGYCIMFFVVKR